MSTITPIQDRGGISGFTLAELLVVIAIMGILAAMLLSGLAHATSKARSLYCKNNLRKIGEALEMYVEDNNGVYPNYQTREGVLWEDALQPYYPLDWYNQLNQCPAYEGVLPSRSAARGLSGGMVSSYGYNTWGVTWKPVDNPAVNYCLGLGVDAAGVWREMGVNEGIAIKTVLSHRESQIVEPSEMYAFMDSRGSPMTIPDGNNTIQAWAGWDSTDGIPVSKDNYPFLQYSPQHGAYFNVLSCDLHVADVRVSDLFETVPPAGPGPLPDWKTAPNWNIDHQPHVEDWLFR